MDTIVKQVKQELQNLEEFFAKSDEINIDQVILPTREGAPEVINTDLCPVPADRFSKSTLQNIEKEQSCLLEQSDDVEIKGEPLPLSTHHNEIVCGDLHKISQSTISRIVAKVSKRLALKLGQFIKFPSLSDQAEIKRRFFSIAGFPGVIGCIDCTHIPIKNPNREHGEVFRNRKGWFSLNVQLVCGPSLELLVYDIVVRWPGSVHDTRIFASSRCCLRFQEGDLAGSGILLGDSGYAQTNYMFTPVINPQTHPEHLYNRAHIQTRNIIE